MWHQLGTSVEGLRSLLRADQLSIVHEPPDDPKKVFPDFEKVATRCRSSEYPVLELFECLAGETFDFYCKEYAKSAKLLDTAERYDTVKIASSSRFEKLQPLEKKIQRTVSHSPHPAEVLLSLRGRKILFKKA